MIKTSLKPLALLVAAVTAPAQAQLIISEYVEGSSSNKAVELYNTSGAELSLDGYTISLYSNGNGDLAAPTQTLTLTGTLAANATYVIINSGSNDALKAKADTDSAITYFNGDDALVLTKDGAIVDSFGQLGVDPGSAWDEGGVTTANKTLRRKASITSGRTDATSAFNPSEQWEQFDQDDFSGLGSHGATDGGDNGGDNGGDTGTEPLVCNDPSTTINAIQGNGATSPLKDQVVIIEAVVTADLQADDQLKGFFVQSLEKDMDTDAMTSEGVFVYYKDLDVNVGDIVRLEGTVQEYYNATQIGNVTRAQACGTADIKPVQLTLPVAAIDDLEAFEGMLVSIDQQLYVNNTYGLGRYGEVALGTERLYQGTQVARPGEDANALEAQNLLKEILIDDGSTLQNLDPKYPQGGLSAYNSLRLGDTVNNITGVVGYSFNKYRIHPTMTPEFVNTNERTEAPALEGEGDLRVASFNVLNYFNGDGQGGGFPTPRGADNEEELVRQQAKLVSAITALDADVIGLMEIENDGFGEFSAISDLVAAINEEADSEYAFVNFNTDKIGTDDITTAIIYRKDVVEEAGTASFTTEAPFDYSNRPPIAQSFRKLDNHEQFTVAVAHLKSKGGCKSAEGDNADLGDGQGCWNAIRTEGANKYADWLMSYPTGNQDADIILVGDMNAYAMEDPIKAFADKGFANVMNHVDGDNFGYSYTFSGRLGILDHAVASASLLEKVTDATDWHINADEPAIFDYNTEYKSETQVANYYAEHAYRSSDHDPVIVEIKTVAGKPPVDPRPMVEAGQIFQVRENSQIGLAIGKLVFTDADSDISPVKRFIVTGTDLRTRIYRWLASNRFYLNDYRIMI
ncbi:MAG: ExeM/NucH family extracellular endonuclease, partial [Pseudomonadota bacterium]